MDQQSRAGDENGRGRDTPPETVVVISNRPPLASPLRLLGDIAADFWRGRELAWRLFVRNLRGMYRQTILGLFWIFLPPIANTSIWVFLRGQNVFSFQDDERFNGTLYILTGMVLWQSFIEAFQMPMDAISRNRGMLTKLNFPREALLLEGIGDLFFNFLIRLLLLIPAFLWYWQSVNPVACLMALLSGGLMILFAAGMGMILAPFGSLYHDVGRFISLAAPFWMIVTPIIYQVADKQPDRWLVWLNPAAPLLVAARDLLVTGSIVHQWPAVAFAIISLPVWLLGLVVWRVSIPAIVERMPA